MNKPLLQAARGETPDRYPIWFLRQAGRYLPEYRAIRSQVSFMELCKNPKLAAEVTWQPLRRYDLDASIIFSDILVPCVAMGQELTFDPGHGPVLSGPIRDKASYNALKQPNVANDLGYVGEAISLTKTKLEPHQTMIGFAGAPFTVASYMIEGGSSKTFLETKRLLFTQPSVFEDLIKRLTEVTAEYLALQVAAGAEYLMLFDTWAGQIASLDFRQFVVPHLKSLLEEVSKLNVPVCYFAGQSSDILHELSGMAMDVVAIDWRVPLSRANQILRNQGLDVGLQGNLDPLSLIGPEAIVRQRVRTVLSEAQAVKSHIFNLGHGLQPITPPESLTWVIDEVRKVKLTEQ